MTSSTVHVMLLDPDWWIFAQGLAPVSDWSYDVIRMECARLGLALLSDWWIFGESSGTSSLIGYFL